MASLTNKEQLASEGLAVGERLADEGRQPTRKRPAGKQLVPEQPVDEGQPTDGRPTCEQPSAGSHPAVAQSAVGEALSGLRSLRIGQGYDVHAFAEGRALVLGGVNIPHTRGLLGHSDADVLAHAVADALLGGIRGGDIGKLFPDDDSAYAGADSLKLLAAVADKVRAEGFAILDVDSVIAAQAPKLSPYRDQMRENLAHAMGVSVENVGVKATTTEHLGFEGREEGISASAVCLLCRC